MDPKVISTDQPIAPESVSKILVVDDDSAYRRLVGLRFRAVGEYPLTASTHAEALRLCREDAEIGVVLLDYTMEGSDPKHLIEQINSLGRSIRIIGHSVRDRQSDFGKLGVNEFFLKPLNVGDFIAHLNGQ